MLHRRSGCLPYTWRLKFIAIAEYPFDATGRTSHMSDNFRRSIQWLALSLLVAGCATSPEQQARRDDERCVAGGRQPNTKAHDDCVSALQAQRDTRMQQRHRELVERPAATPNRY
jgi:hypothetical protein